MKLDLNTEQLEFLQFIIDNFEYNDDEERALKDSIESQLYEVRGTRFTCCHENCIITH